MFLAFQYFPMAKHALRACKLKKQGFLPFSFLFRDVTLRHVTHAEKFSRCCNSTSNDAKVRKTACTNKTCGTNENMGALVYVGTLPVYDSWHDMLVIVSVFVKWMGDSQLDDR